MLNSARHGQRYQSLKAQIVLLLHPAGDFGGKRKLLSGGATNSRSDRIAQALSAAQASIARSVTSGGKLDSTISASRDGVAYARLATQESAEPGGSDSHTMLSKLVLHSASVLCSTAAVAGHEPKL